MCIRVINCLNFISLDIQLESLHTKIPLGKKVKPGYKKKRMEVIKKEIKKIERERIEEIYRKKSRNESRKSR